MVFQECPRTCKHALHKREPRVHPVTRTAPAALSGQAGVAAHHSMSTCRPGSPRGVCFLGADVRVQLPSSGSWFRRLGVAVTGVR